MGWEFGWDTAVEYCGVDWDGDTLGLAGKKVDGIDLGHVRSAAIPTASEGTAGLVGSQK
jgi:hypothetical protein